MDLLEEKYGRFSIKSGRLKTSWAANGFRRKELVAKATGSTRADAIEQVKAGLDKLAAVAQEACDAEGAPTAAVYEEALLAISPLNKSYRSMLAAHLHAPDRLLSATKLAEAAGYRSYSGANLHYGKLGYLIAQEIGFAPPTREDGTPIWTCAIARDPAADLDVEFNGLVALALRHMDAPHFEWQMRPQFAEALLRLGY